MQNSFTTSSKNFIVLTTHLKDSWKDEPFVFKLFGLDHPVRSPRGAVVIV